MLTLDQVRALYAEVKDDTWVEDPRASNAAPVINASTNGKAVGTFCRAPIAQDAGGPLWAKYKLHILKYIESLKTLLNCITAFQAEVSTLKSTNASLTQANATLKSTNDHLTQANATLKSTNDSLTEANTELNSTNAILTQTLTQANLDRQAEVAELKQTVDGLQVENDSLKQTVSDNMREIGEHEEILAGLSSDNAAIRQELEACKEQAAAHPADGGVDLDNVDAAAVLNKLTELLGSGDFEFTLSGHVARRTAQ